MAGNFRREQTELACVLSCRRRLKVKEQVHQRYLVLDFLVLGASLGVFTYEFAIVEGLNIQDGCLFKLFLVCVLLKIFSKGFHAAIAETATLPPRRTGGSEVVVDVQAVGLAGHRLAHPLTA